MIVEASAPSNIALIKYMGKVVSADNRPTNSSFSWTLEHLRTTVSLEFDPSLREDHWSPLSREGFQNIELSEKGRQKFLRHLDRIRQFTGTSGFYHVRSANNFPSDCGIASSASSFAALTRAGFEMVRIRHPEVPIPSTPVQAELSRLGSGSSCRSFFGPWVLWGAEGVRGLELPFPKLIHQVAIVDARQKKVSSSEAHVRCMESLLFAQRPDRAEKRLESLLVALKKQDWEQAFQISWAEFWDMHALFETSKPPFGYMTGGSLNLLELVRDYWNDKKDGPIATMDAGANVHLLWRPDQKASAQAFQDVLSTYGTVIADGLV